MQFITVFLTESSLRSPKVSRALRAGLLGCIFPLALILLLQGCASSSAPPDPPKDKQAPTAPGNLAATSPSSTQVNLAWTAATDNAGVTGYMVEQCAGNGCSNFSQTGTTAATSYSDTGLLAGTDYGFRVRATDAAGNLSAYSNIARIQTPSASDTTPPSTPSGLTATAKGTSEIDLTWSASTDNVGVTSYEVDRCTGSGCTATAGITTTNGSTLSYQSLGLAAATTYGFRVRAKDAAGNFSGYSSAAYATTSSGSDTTSPSAPSNLTATAVSSTQINLGWTASTDNVGVTGYKVERCSGASCSSFAQITTTGGTTVTYSNTGLTASTSYSYRLRATDAAGNLSGYSNTASATTPAAVDTTPPSAPSNLTATAASSGQINLSWTASTDNVGVTGYKVERCSGASCSSFTQVGTTSGAVTYADSGLSASASYSYRVRATDAAGNLSGYSNTATATTQSGGGSSITVSVSPRRGGITTAQKLSLTASLANDTTNAGVTWSAKPGGSFSACSAPCTSVSFTPPSAAGVVTITATSVADGTKTASSSIGVTDLAGVTTYLNGNSRQGGNLQEHALATSGPTAVNSTNFGKLFSCTVDAAIYVQPLWVANVSISGVSHNVVYVATQHDTIYAFDADASPCVTLWKASLWDSTHGGASGETWITSSDAGCGDLVPDIGVVGTPVIDLSGKTMYVVSKTKTSSTNFHQKLHALDITSGSEQFSGPVAISATVTGTGDGSSGGHVSFDTLRQNQRPALLLSSGHVIIAWASHCDNGPYHGWVMSYHVSGSALAQEAVVNLSANGINGGIWMSGNGPLADSSGNIYMALGNGTFNANSGGSDYGDAIVKLGPPSGGTFSVLSYFRSNTLISPDDADTDQGSGGAMLLPGVGSHNNLTQAGKDGNVYVLDQTGLGGLGGGSNAVQFLSGGLPTGMWSSPTYWNGNVYYGPAQDGGSGASLRAFSYDIVTSGLLSSLPTSKSTHSFNFSGPTAPISSSGTSNGIVWALDNSQWNSSCSSTSTCQTLYAFDATNLATQLYSNGGTNTGSGAVKFTVPTVANGRVYVGGQTTLTVYGLLP